MGGLVCPCASRKLRQGLGVLPDESDAELPGLAVADRVDEVEDAGGGAQPFCPVIERPDAVRLRQPFHQPANEQIASAALRLLRDALLRVILLSNQQLRRQSFARLSPWQHETALGIESVTVAPRLKTCHFRNESGH